MPGFSFVRYLFGLSLLAASCQLVAGDFAIEDPASCGEGRVQCVGNVLQRCNPERDAWDNVAVCASEALCDASAGACQMAVCEPGERLCVGVELQLCNGTRDGWITFDTCATAGHCTTQAGGCMELPCEPGTIQCNGAVLEYCKDDQSGWGERATCASAALCDEVTGTCKEPCSAGQFKCEGEKLQSCGPTLDWTTIQVCESDALCDATAGICRQGGCSTPGVFRCSETGVLESCPDDLTAWTTVASCDSAAHCDAVTGTCMVEPCMPGEYQCNGATLEVCKSDRTGRDPVSTCETEGLCQLTLSEDSTTCAPPLCEVGDYHCEGPQPQICNAGRTGYRNNGSACATPELCDSVTGLCKPPVCEPGQTRCTGAQPEECNPGQTDYASKGSPCASAPLCNPRTGTCGDVVCNRGQTRCDPVNPTHLQRCKDTLDGWDGCDTCATARLCSVSVGAITCDAMSCREPTCAIGDVWCGGTDNRELHACPESRMNSEPIVLDVCATTGLCQQSHAQGKRLCNEPTCALTDLWCGGSGNRTLFKCPSSRINSEATNLGTCVTNGLCEQAHAQGATACPPPACNVGQTQCGGSGNRTLRMCNAERTGYQDCDTCDTSALCTDSLSETACNTSACHVCLAGQKQCAGSQLQVCNADRDGWTTLGSCDSAALCMSSLTPSSQMTCDACATGNRRCAGAQPQVCSDPGTSAAVWADSGMECDAVTLCDAGACICSLGALRCNPTSGNYEECTASGWTVSGVCEMGCDDATGCL